MASSGGCIAVTDAKPSAAGDRQQVHVLKQYGARKRLGQVLRAFVQLVVVNNRVPDITRAVQHSGRDEPIPCSCHPADRSALSARETVSRIAARTRAVSRRRLRQSFALRSPVNLN